MPVVSLSVLLESIIWSSGELAVNERLVLTWSLRLRVIASMQKVIIC